MIGARHILASALAVGAAILAATVLQSAPAEARRAGAHSKTAKHHGIRSVHGRLTQHRLKSTKSITSSKTAGVGTVQTTPTLNPNGGQATTGIGNLPHTPPINPGGGPPGNPNGGQTTTGGGNLPHTPPIYPGGPKTMPLDPSGGPKPVPVPIDPNGGPTTAGAGNVPHTPPFNPSGDGHNATGSGQHQHAGVYVDGGRGYEHPCWWLKRKYDQTSNVDWINRYRQCLSWHRTD